MSADGELFPGFASRYLTIGKVRIHCRMGGSGPPLLLLHGYPQTHACWHKVAAPLAERFTVVAPDLRGYGKSSCPDADLEHRAYSKRVMAGDMVRLMLALGFRRFR
ncbi:MAG: alpha/beta fold hydrolase [Hyphomicrobiaceae bacterium]